MPEMNHIDDVAMLVTSLAVVTAIARYKAKKEVALRA